MATFPPTLFGICSQGDQQMPPASLGRLPFRLDEVTSREILEHIYKLRVDAWRTKLELPGDVTVWHDRFDPIAKHWAFFDGDRPVAAARLTISARLTDVPDADVYRDVLPVDLVGPIASLTRLVVHPDYRGRGLARPLDQVRIAAAEIAGCTCVIGSTHETKRVTQLESEGFEAYAPQGRNSEESGILSGLLPIAIIVLRLPRRLTTGK
jgi:GNAT superfamily N-acetyltransferase